MTNPSVSDLGGSSRQSLASARKALDAIVGGLSAGDAAAFAGELFAVVKTLDSSTPLRRALTDNSRDAHDKAALLSQLFAKNFSPRVVDLLAQVASLRWSSPSDLADAIEHLAVESSATAANLAGELDRLEEELFAFSRVVSSNPELRQTLNSAKYSVEGKRTLVNSLLGSKTSASTNRMIGELVSGLRGRNIESTIAFYSAATAARRDRVIALVRSAIALTDSQKAKLTETLMKKIGQPVRLNIEVDPTVIGGISIRFADELIDATIVNRLADAGRALAG